MLKSSIPPPINNSYGPAVRTGTVPRVPLPGPTPPFLPSAYITSVSFGDVAWWNGSGDTWPTAWAADGTVYGWACDASNDGQPESPMSLWKLNGDPYTQALAPEMVSNAPIDYSSLCVGFNSGNDNVKPGGMIAVGQTLYVGISCMNYGDDPVFNRQHNTAGFISQSLDNGITWSNATAVNAFPGRFAAPVLVSCGPGTPCVDAAGANWTYVFFAGAFNNEAYWDNNDAMFLARVHPTDIGTPAAYSYFAGLGSGNASQPYWTLDSSQAQPSIQFGSMIGENAVTYNAHIQRFVVANYGFIDNNGLPRPWHTQPYMTPHRTQLIMLEAAQPWGPWNIFYRSDDSFQAPGLYTPTFPSAYHRPVISGTAQMIMFFACLDGAANCRYTLNYQTVNITIASG
jgi:hypothetical protein